MTRQCDRFVSWKPSPECEWVDAFTEPWRLNFYAFPPFTLIPRVLSKIKMERCEGIVVAPYWPTQAWFPLFNEMKISEVILITKNRNELFSPYLNREHGLSYKVTLMAAKLSGKHESGLGYNSINTSRSASTIHNFWVKQQYKYWRAQASNQVHERYL